MTENEINLIKIINTNTDGTAYYTSDRISILLSNNLSLILDMNIPRNCNLDNEFRLKELYESEEIKSSLSISKISIQTITEHGNYNIVLKIIQLHYKYFNVIPIIEKSFDACGFLYYTLYYNKNQLLDNTFIQDIVNIKNKDNQYSPNYNFLPTNPFLETIKSISIQTKVRRLGYIKMIVSIFDKSSYYPNSIFNKKIEQEARKFNNDLIAYTNTKGIIEITKTGNSSNPYIDTALSLKLLYTQNNKYLLSKYGKIFNVLNDKLETSSSNYFELSKYEKTFFLFFILQNDSFYLWVLLDLIYIQGNNTTIKDIKEIFQDYIIKQLEFTIAYSNISDKDKIKISLQLKRIKSWKKPKVYLEHIIEPRLNWLLDLDILNKEKFKKNKIALSREGLTLFDSLNFHFEQFHEKYTLLRQVRCSSFFNIINQVYKIGATDIDNDDIISIDNYIDESFYLFKTIAPNRVTASQAILYTCFMILFKAKKIVNFCTIQNYLGSKKNTKFIFEWYKTENDGSIRRKK